MQKKEQPTPHKHCIICGKVIPEDSVFCSKLCEEAQTRRDKRYKTMTRMYYLFFAIILFIIMLLFITGKAL